jgi:hypothetical protein
MLCWTRRGFETGAIERAGRQKCFHPGNVFVILRQRPPAFRHSGNRFPGIGVDGRLGEAIAFAGSPQAMDDGRIFDLEHPEFVLLALDRVNPIREAVDNSASSRQARLKFSAGPRVRASATSAT